ncbi:MAG: hypothetical protein HDS66_00630 [Bacteroidales bacterium]|nr:hypothetical protein [Bacteroidales bacterium]
MNRILLSILLCLLAISPALAADKADNDASKREQQRRELIDFKIKYLIKEVDIPADKQAEFERLYRKMEDERLSLFREVYRKAKSASKSSTDAEILAASDMIASTKQREGAMELKYYQEFKKLLTPRQLLNLKRAEDRFNRKVMETRGKAPARKN